MKANTIDKIVLRIFGVLLIVGGLTHWLIILGFLSEKTPYLIGLYFHSLAVLSSAAGVGLWFKKDWAIKLTLFICVTQIPAHLFMIYLDAFRNWNSGYSIPMRVLDIGLVTIGLIYLSLRKASEADGHPVPPP